MINYIKRTKLKYKRSNEEFNRLHKKFNQREWVWCPKCKEILDENKNCPNKCVIYFVNDISPEKLEKYGSGTNKIDNSTQSDGQFQLKVMGSEEIIPPERKQIIINSIKRDSQLVRDLKCLYENKCQVCGKQIIIDIKNSYSEAHHLKPLGGEHKGPDDKRNILILCPNHHVEFDFGAMAINPNTMKFEHININNEFVGKKILLKHNLSNEFINYHFNKIYKV